MIVTERVFDRVIQANEFLLRPCYLSGHWHGNWPSGELWRSVAVDSLPGVRCFVRRVPRCREVADDFCRAVLEGETTQPTGAWQRFRYSAGL